MRGRILEVPNLLDYTLLREPRRGVEGLMNVGRDGCSWSDRECYSAGVPGQREAVMREAWSCCSSAEVREGALVSNRGSFNVESVSSLTEMSELGGSVTHFSVTELQCRS